VSEHVNGERPGMRRATERMTKRLVDGGMPHRQAEMKARKHAKRVERGAAGENTKQGER